MMAPECLIDALKGLFKAFKGLQGLSSIKPLRATRKVCKSWTFKPAAVVSAMVQIAEDVFFV